MSKCTVCGREKGYDGPCPFCDREREQQKKLLQEQNDILRRQENRARQQAYQGKKEKEEQMESEALKKLIEAQISVVETKLRELEAYADRRNEIKILLPDWINELNLENIFYNILTKPLYPEKIEIPEIVQSSVDPAMPSLISETLKSGHKIDHNKLDNIFNNIINEDFSKYTEKAISKKLLSELLEEDRMCDFSAILFILIQQNYPAKNEHERWALLEQIKSGQDKSDYFFKASDLKTPFLIYNEKYVFLKVYKMKNFENWIIETKSPALLCLTKDEVQSLIERHSKNEEKFVNVPYNIVMFLNIDEGIKKIFSRIQEEQKTIAQNIKKMAETVYQTIKDTKKEIDEKKRIEDENRRKQKRKNKTLFLFFVLIITIVAGGYLANYFISENELENQYNNRIKIVNGNIFNDTEAKLYWNRILTKYIPYRSAVTNCSLITYKQKRFRVPTESEISTLSNVIKKYKIERFKNVISNLGDGTRLWFLNSGQQKINIITGEIGEFATVTDDWHNGDVLCVMNSN